MSPDDPRHGTDAGHCAHHRAGVPPCEPCLAAHRRANKARLLAGTPPAKVPALGTQRRVQALQRLGYSRKAIAQAAGYSDQGGLTYVMQSATILAATADKITAVYERLSMTIPTGPGVGRAHTWAERFGYPPPLAWDNPDDPDERPKVGNSQRHRDDVDEAVVTRVLAGEKLPTTAAERRAILARWVAQGRSARSLEKRMGWKESRYRGEVA